jgi:ABC-2 type transport system ATP-binding protein
MSADPAIVVHDVAKRFGTVTALDGVHLEVPAGTVYGLLGPNGAGKTTLVRILTALLRPDRGRAEVLGLDVGRHAELVRPRIGLAGQYAAVDENLTGRENLRMVGRLYHLPVREARRRADEILAEFSLEDAADRPVKTYSGGMRRRLDLGASLVGQPEVLFLDEPTTGLDPRTRLELWDLIERLVAGGTTLMLTTQYLDEADALADRIAVIDHGRVIADGTTEELKARLGRDVVEVRVAPEADVESALERVRHLAEGEPHADRDARRVALPVSGGPQSLLAVVRALDVAGIGIEDVGLHRPTLDDVFLALTGSEAEGGPSGDDAVARARRDA